MESCAFEVRWSKIALLRGSLRRTKIRAGSVVNAVQQIRKKKKEVRLGCQKSRAHP